VRDFQSRMEDGAKKDSEWFEDGALVLPEVVGASYPQLAREVVAAKALEVAEDNEEADDFGGSM
jgi:hypothetical protein